MKNLILLIAAVLVVGMQVPSSAALFDTLTDIGVSAQHLSRGDVEGFSTGANSIFENPAGLYRIEQYSFSFFTTRFFDEVNYNNFSVAYKTPWGTFAAGYMEAAVSNIEETGVDGGGFHVPVGTFNFKNAIFNAGYQTSPLENLSVGFTYHYYSKSFYGILGTGANISLGSTLDLGFIEGSLFARNLLPGKNVNFNSGGSEELSTEIVSSVRVPVYDFNGYGELKYMAEKVFPSVGVTYTPHWFPYINLSGGLRQYLVINEVRSNWTYGIGLVLHGIEFYFAQEVSDHPLQDHKSYFSVNLNLK